MYRLILVCSNDCNFFRKLTDLDFVTEEGNKNGRDLINYLNCFHYLIKLPLFSDTWQLVDLIIQ